MLDNEVLSQNETMPVENQEQSAQTQESQKEQNFRLLRERAENAERRALELERMMQMNMNANQQSTRIEIAEDDDLDVSDDMYVEGKQLKKFIKKQKNQSATLQKTIEELNQKISLANAEVRLKNQFNDFDSVVTKENLDKLASQKPALYRSIMANSDIYDRGYTAYELIKGSGLNINEYEAQDRRLEENRNKPRSAGNVSYQSSDTPLTRVGDYDRRTLTEERKAQLRAQVSAAKMYR